MSDTRPSMRLKKGSADQSVGLLGFNRLLAEFRATLGKLKKKKKPSNFTLHLMCSGSFLESWSFPGTACCAEYGDSGSAEMFPFLGSRRGRKRNINFTIPAVKERTPGNVQCVQHWNTNFPPANR